LNELLNLDPATSCPEYNADTTYLLYPDNDYSESPLKTDFAVLDDKVPNCPFSGPPAPPTDDFEYQASFSNCAPVAASSAVLVAVVVLAAGTSILGLLIMINNFIPKGPCIKFVLEKLGCLWCFEIDYPTEADPEKRKVEIMSATYRKAAEKCGCTATLCGSCTIDGPAVDSAGDMVEPSTALFDPMTKLYRCIGLPGTDNCCGKWCAVHGPNPDASNDNILCAPGAAVLQNCCGSCCADNGDSTTTSDKTLMNTSGFGFDAAEQPKENPIADTNE
jgi:hypothetical protein